MSNNLNENNINLDFRISYIYFSPDEREIFSGNMDNLMYHYSRGELICIREKYLNKEIRDRDLNKYFNNSSYEKKYKIYQYFEKYDKALKIYKILGDYLLMKKLFKKTKNIKRFKKIRNYLVDDYNRTYAYPFYYIKKNKDFINKFNIKENNMDKDEIYNLIIKIRKTDSKILGQKNYIYDIDYCNRSYKLLIS